MPSPTQTPPKLSISTSLFLDLLRIAAALAVFGYHCQLIWYGYNEQSGTLVHRAVIVFFVLSGFVIAHSTLSKKRDLRQYTVARLSRLYSVVLPALLLTLCLTLLGRTLNPGFYLPLMHGHEALRYLSTAVFLQSNWNHFLVPYMNRPFWSLGYEFWYYVLFGIIVLVKSTRWKVFLSISVILFIGPSIMLLAPCWLMGVALYLYRLKSTIPFVVALTGLVFFSLGFAALLFYLPDFPMRLGLSPFLYSNSFLSDALLALVLAGTIWFFDQAFFSVETSAGVVKVVRFFADHTFSLYLYHMPLVMFVRACIPFDLNNPWEVVAMVSALLATILILSIFTESKRSHWANAFNWMWSKLLA